MTSDGSAAHTERLCALDSLRAIMMLLGIVLHTIVSYLSISLGAAWSFPNQLQTVTLTAILGIAKTSRGPTSISAGNAGMLSVGTAAVNKDWRYARAGIHDKLDAEA